MGFAASYRGAACSAHGRPHAGQEPSSCRSISSAFSSIGKPASTQAEYPPRRAHARYPRFRNVSATRALVASWCQVQ
jgi:hypothetical protein